MVLSPLSWLMNDGKGHGFASNGSLRIKCELTYMTYLDDIKLYASTKDDLKSVAHN